jgi:SOUL heme-binding protein
MGVVFGKINEETPAHSVLMTGDGYEVRSYPPQVAAIYVPSTDTEMSHKSPREMQGTGFRALASYYGILSSPAQIPAKGKTPESISMTAPVLIDYPEKSFEPTASVAEENQEEPMEQISFLLPAKYKSIDDAPVPSNPAVVLVQLPTRTNAVITFSGNPRPAWVREHSVKLREMVSKDKISFTGEKPILAQYNPPFSLSWLKTNELLLPVDASTVASTATSTTANTDQNLPN